MDMDEATQITQNTQQATQPDSQFSTDDIDGHLLGYLLPCNPKHILRLDFVRTKLDYTLGRDQSNDFHLAGKKVSE